MKPFTVVGVCFGPWCARALVHVHAYSAQEAVRQAEGVLNSHSGAIGDEKRLLEAAAVFDRHLECATDFPESLSGDDRAGIVKNEARCMKFSEFTVVSVDPFTGEVATKVVTHASAGNAERNPAFDFHLIGGTLKGAHKPVLVYQPEAEPLGRASTRQERVSAMCKYSSSYSAYLTTDLPMHAPIPA